VNLKKDIPPYMETGPVLAQDILDVITEQVERWQQGSWRYDWNGLDKQIDAMREDPKNPSCTTAFCVAGWVAALYQVRWARLDASYIGNPDTCDCVGPRCTNEAHILFVSEFAREKLGLANYDADALFAGDNNFEQVQAGLKMIVDGHPRAVASAVSSLEEDEEDREYA
jgi:hypothetical protein